MLHQPLRSNDIRESNEKLVLNLIFQHGSISQSQIVQHTGLKAPTVFRIFAKLEEAGFIRQCKDGRGLEDGQEGERKGRRPSFYCARAESGYAVGVDFSSLAVAVIVVDFGNCVIYKRSKDLAPRCDRDEILRTIETMIASAIEESRIDRERLLGIGIAAPGVVDTVTGRVLHYGRIVGLSGYSIKDHYEAIFDVPVFVHNNASVIAASAYHYGVARDEASLLAILVRSGVGGALVTHGNIFLNGTATAIEVGRTSIFPASIEGVADDEAALENRVAEQPMLERLRADYDVDSWEAVQRTLTVGEVAAALREERLALASAIRNLHHIFHPEAVLLISRFPILSEVLGNSARRALPERRVIPMVYDPVQACYGATDIVFKQFFNLTQVARSR